MGTLDGKVALVTGSGRGIGQAIACKLASEGARLVVNDLDEAPARDTIARINEMGSQAVACVGDVTAPDFGERFVDLAVDSFGTPDIIVNNAGYTWDNVIQKMSDEQFLAVIDVHLTAPFRILRAAAGPIRAAAKQEAAEGKAVFRKIVNISSVSGVYGNAGQANYSSGKLGVVGLTKTLAKEWGRYQVTVNAVRFRTRAYPAHPGPGGRGGERRHRGAGDRGRRAPRAPRVDSADHTARSRRHPRRSGRRRLPLLHT